MFAQSQLSSTSLNADTFPTMDPPPSTAVSAAVSTVAVAGNDPLDSSPRSNIAEAWGDPHQQLVGSKVRLMCSYGGRIIPRPHDKSLCYVGGETRIVVVDRHSSLSDLYARLSRSLMNGRLFTLKYQLPNEDLDSLISVATDEDLDNMIEEYDRTASVSPLKPSSRLRLFLFSSKPETGVSMGSLLGDAKSETWFVDALNNAVLSRGVSDLAAIDGFLNLGGVRESYSCHDLETQANESPVIPKQVLTNDSPMLEKNSSFGSSSSSPTMSNLPPIQVRAENNGVRGQDENIRVEEQFSRMSFNLPPLIPSGMVLSPNLVACSGETMNLVVSDDEKSEPVAAVGSWKPPLPLQPPQNKYFCGRHINLSSPESLTSDRSMAPANSPSKPSLYQEQSSTNSTAEPEISATTMKRAPEPAENSACLTIPPLADQHQPPLFVRGSTHFMPHHAAGSVPIQSYYPIYASHHQIDQQYPFYVMPFQQPQPYNMSVQSEATILASGRVSAPPNPAFLATPPAKPASPGIPEVHTSMCKTNPPLLQVQHGQFQHQYVGFSQNHHLGQSISSMAPAAAPSYGFEYANPANERFFYNPNQPAPLPSHHQTMTHAVAKAAFSDASKQGEADAS